MQYKNDNGMNIFAKTKPLNLSNTLEHIILEEFQEMNTVKSLNDKLSFTQQVNYSKF